ncbi:MAG: trehalose-phosphatase [Dehalococcoidia bacterium]
MLQCWDEVTKWLKEAKQILLFLDYDGTVTPIAARPEMAVLSSRAREILKRISHHSLFKLAIISGRSLSVVRALVGLENIAYVGNHGLEIECPVCHCQAQGHERISFIHPIAKEIEPVLKKLEQNLKEKLIGIDGVIIENKELTLSIHYRLATETAAKKIKRLFLEAIECGDKLQVTEGKKVLELRPLVGWNKGKAIEWLLRIYGRSGSLPIFAGDDVTDEDGFNVLRRVGGISVFIGESTASSAADYYLNSPEQLHHWLEKLLEIRQ